jgi:DNA-binding LytR/AlgR family response regulator
MKKPLRCLLLDDELPGLAYLKMLCQQMPELEVVKAYNDPVLFLQEAVDTAFDLAILDIEMAGIDGLTVARSLQGKPVIFTTAYKQYATDAFDIDAVDYLVKPIKKERLQQAVEKADRIIETLRQSSPFMRLNTDKGRALLFFDRLAYITTSPIDSRDKEALLSDGTTMILKNISFDKLIAQLPSDRFCQINKQEIIVLTAVRFFSHDEITVDLSGRTTTLHLSEAYRAAFLQKTRN